MDKVRIDKWLWAARFFKTRSVAKQALDSGKVYSNGHKLKASKEIQVGMRLSVRQGWDWKDIEILALSEQRKSAPGAQMLYAETVESQQRRAAQAEQRRQLKDYDPTSTTRPTKKQRRQIHRFKDLMQTTAQEQDHQD